MHIQEEYEQPLNIFNLMMRDNVLTMLPENLYPTYFSAISWVDFIASKGIMSYLDVSQTPNFLALAKLYASSYLKYI